MVGRWAYARFEGVEAAAWRGAPAAPLRPHFHLEDQVTLVLRGARCFLTPYGPLRLTAGKAALLPAGLVHAAPRHEPPCDCVNFYLPAPAPAEGPQRALAFDLDGAVEELAEAPLRLRALAAAAGTAAGAAPPSRLVALAKPWLAEDAAPVAELAARLGLSREGFSRAFARQVGVSPRAYRLAARLTAARTLLKAGTPASAAAYQAGFADQSHLTRSFAAAFGTSPQAYRRALT